nr:uncharacterized protein LOC115128850 isoform X1 [Oncorhynchus nerka]
MSTSEDFALSSEHLAARDNGRGIAFHFFDAVDSGYSLQPGVIPTNFDVQQLQEMPNLPSPIRNLHESENNAMRSPTIALCSCEGSPIATIIHLMAEMSSRDELKNRLRRQLVITIQQRDEYQRRDREAKAKVRMFERKAIVLRAQVSALQPGQFHLPSGQISNLVRASRQIQELREQARQYQMPIPIRTVRGSQNSAMRCHGDTLCPSCGQPLTSISIRLRAVMRSRQALKNTFRRQFALIIQQRDELRTRAREAEAKGRILERRHI